ncbi:hypothetical protein BDP27DRAFT_1483303 [Rhodocollybia butyracea]|uniref:MYND-type domain-containing protein n=1 Tax=Rhodocollybia butyracea TaxID=206335 RepID=A0A9P5PC57_9AGAR|nr:hypothetical protein BDP27DRAFT_1483303 [Rhodocollybia butyracea]
MSQQVFSFITKAQIAYHSGKYLESSENYQKAIKKILKDERVGAKIPPSGVVPSNDPREVLPYCWALFTHLFKDKNAMKFVNQASDPEGYKLLNLFRVGNTHPSHARFRSEEDKILFKGIQIVATVVIGIVVWDKRDRATAAKRYREAIDLAKTHEVFNCLGDSYGEAPNAGAPGKEQLPYPYTRYEADGTLTMVENHVVATDCCAHCGKRDVKLSRCSKCMKVPYCGLDCQKADWKYVFCPLSSRIVAELSFHPESTRLLSALRRNENVFVTTTSYMQ